MGLFLPTSVVAYVLLLMAGGWLNLADWRRLAVVFGREVAQPKESTGLE